MVLKLSEHSNLVSSNFVWGAWFKILSLLNYTWFASFLHWNTFYLFFLFFWHKCRCQKLHHFLCLFLHHFLCHFLEFTSIFASKLYNLRWFLHQIFIVCIIFASLFKIKYHRIVYFLILYDLKKMSSKWYSDQKLQPL